MTILEGRIQEEYMVTDVQMEESTMRRLESLGINNGTKMQLMNRKKNGTVIIKVRGARWAVGKDIAVGIQVTSKTKEEVTYGKH
ncbi:MAG: FeoA domain-containing protein [Lachnospiraceae bacterium]